MKISTLGFCLLTVAAWGTATGCSKKGTDEAASTAQPAPASTEPAPPPGPESEPARAAGAPPSAAGLDPKPAAFASHALRLDPDGNGKKGELDDIKAVVRDGAAKYGGSPLMAPWPLLKPEQLQAVAEYVQSLGGGG